jgi:hypothetical protein
MPAPIRPAIALMTNSVSCSYLVPEVPPGGASGFVLEGGSSGG